MIDEVKVICECKENTKTHTDKNGINFCKKCKLEKLSFDSGLTFK